MQFIGYSLDKDGFEAFRPGPEPIGRYQVRGLRCSGTGFLDALIETNCRIEKSNYLGWKHGFPTAQAIPTDHVVIVVVRDPVDWLLSLYRKPWHFRDQCNERSFSQFLRSPVDTVMDEDLWNDELEHNSSLLTRLARRAALFRQRLLPQLASRLGINPLPELPYEDLPSFIEGCPLQYDRHPVTGETLANPMVMRSLKVTAQLGYAARHCSCVFVRYEEVRDRPQVFLDRLAEAFDIQREPEFAPVEARMGGAIETMRRTPPREILPEDLEFIAANLDLSLETRLGYGARVEAMAKQAHGSPERGTSDVGSARHAVR